MVAMKGKNCVAIACDLRFGVQAQTISTDFKVRRLYIVLCFNFPYYLLLLFIFFQNNCFPNH